MVNLNNGYNVHVNYVSVSVIIYLLSVNVCIQNGSTNKIQPDM